ncbi:MAG: M20/M25/M40 family metallo-hydrolase [Planctomycetota bacterium]|nr:M20/M25/M40 family metallo-hydrolase [Planctomycetota bacterium]
MRPALLLFLASCASSAVAQSPVEAARAHRAANGARILADFAELLAIPNVGTDRVNIRRNAEHIRDAFARRGAEMELLEVPDANPVVYGVLDAPNAKRTLGIYVHYDGQPVNAAAWTHPPFEPALYTRAIEAGGERRAFPEEGEAIDPEWRIYARSAGDDKAPIAALLAALDALDAAGIERTAKLVFLFEGEEEMGSPNLGRTFDAFGDRLDVDLWLICDGPVHQSRKPQLVFGVRGITSLEITVYGATRNMHSGHYGNWAPNPGMMLAQLLASTKDEDGNVVIEGFYDSVTPLSPDERAAIASLPDVDASLKAELGLARTEGGGASLGERLLLPSLNVQGLSSGRTGAEARNVIPSTATANIDIRLVKGNEPVAMIDLVEAHVRKRGYHVVREEPDLQTRLAHPRIARIVRGGGYPAARTSLDHPLVRPLAEAAAAAAGEPVILMPSLGGSLPLYLFDEKLGRPVVITPIANHDDNQHAPDENIRIANLWYGIDLMAAIMAMP